MDHPGITLKKKFFEPLGLTNYAIAKAIHVPQTRLSQITLGKRRITADTARRLSVFLGVPARWFLNLQMEYELHLVDKMVIREPIGRHVDPGVLIMPDGVRRFRGEAPVSVEPATYRIDDAARVRLRALTPDAGEQTTHAVEVDYGNGFRALVREPS